MADKSSIEWTDATWNPVTGCTKVSKGCAHCYAKRFSERFRGVKDHPYQQGFDLKLWPSRLNLPFEWKHPRYIFVNSMSDLFHENIPSDFISQVFDTMEIAQWHTYHILTKRSSRMKDFINDRYRNMSVPSHIWLGVSIEERSVLSRVEHLRQTNSNVRFLSLEPLLGPLAKLDLKGIHWIIVGGESGPRFRPLNTEWVREIRDQCKEEGVAFFFKQWGGIRPKSGGNLLDGHIWNQYPDLTEVITSRSNIGHLK